MTNANKLREAENLQEHLQRVVYLLSQRKLAEELAKHIPEQQDGRAELEQKQNLVELQNLLDKLHPADVAHILEALPREDRLMIWDLVKAERDGEILLEVSDAVRETLIENMDSDELVAATEQLDTDEIADLVPDLPQNVVDDVLHSLSIEERE